MEKNNLLLIHSMSQIIYTQQMEIYGLTLTLSIFAIVFCSLVCMDNILNNHPILAIIQGILVVANIVCAIDTIKRMRKTRRDKKEEQELFEKVVSGDDDRRSD